ncbi:MAG: hypothetical protein BWK76_16885 [Desulfobulbaceae bacterium A2]|nr:MAG: hypothetical protein BWK76_16885 [Desulfobulbaceae bacterium A2]
MTPYLQVHTTVAHRDDAERLARAALSEQLAACVQIAGPVHSWYHWKGALENVEEYTVTFKTRKDLLDALIDLLRRLHPYEVPEILATPVLEGGSAYLAWLEQELLPVGNLRKRTKRLWPTVPR